MEQPPTRPPYFSPGSLYLFWVPGAMINPVLINASADSDTSLVPCSCHVKEASSLCCSWQSISTPSLRSGHAIRHTNAHTHCTLVVLVMFHVCSIFYLGVWFKGLVWVIWDDTNETTFKTRGTLASVYSWKVKSVHYFRPLNGSEFLC